MRVLVCGGREYGCIPRGTVRFTPGWYCAREKAQQEIGCFTKALGELIPRPSLVIHGAAKGSDELARLWAKIFSIEDLPFKADWYPNGRAGGMDRSAGPVRNQRMIDEGKPDLVIAFPGGKGTADMVARAKRANVQVIEVSA